MAGELKYEMGWPLLEAFPRASPFRHHLDMSRCRGHRLCWLLPKVMPCPCLRRVYNAHRPSGGALATTTSVQFSSKSVTSHPKVDISRAAKWRIGEAGSSSLVASG